MRLRKSLQNGQERLNEFMRAPVDGGGLPGSSSGGNRSSSSLKSSSETGTIVLTAIICAVLTFGFIVYLDNLTPATVGSSGVQKHGGKTKSTTGNIREEHSLKGSKWKEENKRRKSDDEKKGVAFSGREDENLQGMKEDDPQQHLSLPKDVDVIPKQPYLPRHRGWSTIIYRRPKVSEDSCVAWRQTANCDPMVESAKRESYFDLPCDSKITSKQGSGYCECGGFADPEARTGIRTAAAVNCDPHEAFTCDQACAEENFEVTFTGQQHRMNGGFNFAADDDAADRRVMGQEKEDKDDVIANTRGGYETVPPGAGEDEADADQNNKKAADLLPGEEDREEEEAGEEAEAKLLPKADPTLCVSWRQTGRCTPFGPLESKFDQTCSSLIRNGMSGFCECNSETGYKGPGVPCSHRPFKCEDECDPKVSKKGNLMHPLVEPSSSYGDEAGRRDTGLGTPVTKWTKFNHNLHHLNEAHERFYDLVAEDKQLKQVVKERLHTTLAFSSIGTAPTGDEEKISSISSVEEQHLRHVAEVRRITQPMIANKGKAAHPLPIASSFKRGGSWEEEENAGSGGAAAKSLKTHFSSQVLSDKSIREFDEYVDAKIRDALNKLKKKESQRNPDPAPLPDEGKHAEELREFREKQQRDLAAAIRKKKIRSQRGGDRGVYPGKNSENEEKARRADEEKEEQLLQRLYPVNARQRAAQVNESPLARRADQRLGEIVKGDENRDDMVGEGDEDAHHPQLQQEAEPHGSARQKSRKDDTERKEHDLERAQRELEILRQHRNEKMAGEHHQRWADDQRRDDIDKAEEREERDAGGHRAWKLNHRFRGGNNEILHQNHAVTGGEIGGAEEREVRPHLGKGHQNPTEKYLGNRRNRNMEHMDPHARQQFLKELKEKKLHGRLHHSEKK